MPIVLRCNFSDESLALIEFIYQKVKANALKDKVCVVYIDTGWAATGWDQRVKSCAEYVVRRGFEMVTLKPPQDFTDMILSRGNFPSVKFQWCVSFMKGLPFLSWLDEVDPNCEWIIALPKRQALYEEPISEFKLECQYHGERDVWHPLYQHSDADREKLVANAGFVPLAQRSLECEPCVKASCQDLKRLSQPDIAKTHKLEQTLLKPMFPIGTFGAKGGIEAAIQWARDNEPCTDGKRGSQFSRGCGDPFGCGL